MTNHTYRPLHLRLPRHSPPPPVARIVHYDPQTLARTETPLRPVAVACARCAALIPPDEATRDLLGEFICQSEEECDQRALRNERGGE